MPRSEASWGEAWAGPGRDRGFVTAEAAVALPVLVMFTMALVWVVLAASAQIRCVDAARTGARALARQEPRGAALAAARRAAPRGARIDVSRAGDLVLVTVRARASGPGPLGVNLSARAVAEAEETAGVT
ncbi:TadE family protein [Streptomyces beihaiensis]|uniref:Pilus assembly protein n=1 Tax=Streptomyces beihaiensis TaxID=2984495 RepID=A0ABT3TTQ8_9ACTN|nr:TadE family protein [Streptomyces beihaiensis]MCX3059832.1 pilus assembly protein [Streptomyces beihaiensis]